MDLKTHIVLQKDPSTSDSWVGLIDDGWILALEVDPDGYVVYAGVRENDVVWMRPCDEEGRKCRCVHLEGYTDGASCPWAEPKPKFTSYVWFASARICVNNLIETITVNELDLDDGFSLDMLKRPWVCATESGPIVMYDRSVDAKVPLRLPLSS